MILLVDSFVAAWLWRWRHHATVPRSILHSPPDLKFMYWLCLLGQRQINLISTALSTSHLFRAWPRSMCVCVYVSMCVCVHVCMCVCMYVCIYFIGVLHHIRIRMGAALWQTVRTQNNFIVLPHEETMSPAPCSEVLFGWDLNDPDLSHGKLVLYRLGQQSSLIDWLIDWCMGWVDQYYT